MTKTEAIAELSVLHERLSNPKDCEDGCYSWEDGWYVEAIDMAIEALSAEGAVWNEYEAEFTDLPDIPRYYYEKVVGKMAHEINMLREQLESADAVQGEWILVKGSNGKDYHKCSKCLHTQEITGVKNYCAVCGARMKGGDDE